MPAEFCRAAHLGLPHAPRHPPSELSAAPGALLDLGEFYKKNGQRARLSREVSDGVLRRLDAAEAALPARDASKRDVLSALLDL